MLGQENLLHQITNRIRQSLELPEILNTAVREIGSYLEVDRAKIYKFDADDTGAVIAESVQEQRLPSLLGLHFPAGDIPPQAREMFLKTRQRVIIDVTAQRKIFNQLDCAETGENLSVEDIRYAPVDECHVEYLLAMGVLASLTVPIVYQNRLWGLLAIHHAQPRRFSDRELQIIQLLVDQISIAIAQSNLVIQVQQQAHHEAMINRVSSLLHCPLNQAEIRQMVLEETVKALQGSGGRLHIVVEPTGQPSQIYTYGEQPTVPFIEETTVWKELIGWQETPATHSPTHEEIALAWEQVGKSLIPLDVNTHSSPTFSTSGVHSPQIITSFCGDIRGQSLAYAFESTPIRSILIIPLQYRHQCVGCLSIFRNAYDTEVMWAGRYNRDERNLQPRKSFEAWRELKTEQSPEWTPDEIKLAQSIGIHLYMALMQKRVESMLRHQASHDRLTKLPNRLLFDEQLSLALVNAHQTGEMLAVAFLDLDRFKTVNDTLGHAVGDQLLQQVTERLQSCLRKCDAVARWGGDEFTLLFPHIGYVEDISKISRRILDALNTPFFIEDQELYISASLGISLAPYDGEDAETLLKNADTAMYRAKQQGRNNYQFYLPEMNTQALEKLGLEADLRKALARDELLLYYQPQIDINTGEIVSLEALIRWQHPHLGLVPPNQFIPLAEETGLICPIGEWVIRTACSQHQAWCEQGLAPIPIAVNLSGRQFQQQGLVKTIKQILEETNLEPCYLEVEITESIAMEDIDFTIAVLRELQQMGIKIAMDDFGTGYSSLNSIKYFPLHTIKIDQSFVRDLIQDSSDAAIAKAVVALGKGLNLEVLAEGVETLEQLEFLRAIGCDSAQGYLFSKPLPPEAAFQLLSNWVPAQPQRLLSEGNNLEGCLSYAQVSEKAEVADQLLEEKINEKRNPEEMLIRAKALEVVNQELEQQIIKYKQIEEALRHQYKQEQLMASIAQKIFLNFDLEEVLSKIVREVRQFMGVDRLILYCFEPDWSGQVMVESVTEGWNSLLGVKIEDCCFKENYVHYYKEGRVRAIEDIYDAVLAPCHINLLAQFQVRANLVVPVLQGDNLWGLLIAQQCREPRNWQQHEISLLNQIAIQAAIAIQQAELYRQLASAQPQP
ncbi:MAG: EAL domain-containing protein [Microcoleus vaginatus WJT46-NPBG5]|jgi:diguanylate cyclase (GGDEF)-like protein|nr:EAL domain-containing protein [Microcoleus vaginatus WJT46-NPBG5]